jgi:hypothetical protein
MLPFAIRSPAVEIRWLLVLAAIVATPDRVRGADPLETVRDAFHASSEGLHSGRGKWKYRHYEAVPGGDWQLKMEADFLAQFDGRKYHVDFTFEKDELRRLDSKRLFYDGEKVTVAEFTPQAHPTGAQAHVFTPENYGDGLARGAWGDFPWDVTNLANYVWDPEKLVKNLGDRDPELRDRTRGGSSRRAGPDLHAAPQAWGESDSSGARLRRGSTSTMMC